MSAAERRLAVAQMPQRNERGWRWFCSSGCSNCRSPCACIDASWGSAADQSAAKCPSFRLRERLHDALLEGQPKRPWGIALSAEKCRLVVREMPHRAERSRRWFCSCGCSSRRSPCACFPTCAYTCDRTCTDAGSRCRIRRVSKRPGGRVCSGEAGRVGEFRHDQRSRSAGSAGGQRVAVLSLQSESAFNVEGARTSFCVGRWGDR